MMMHELAKFKSIQEMVIRIVCVCVCVCVFVCLVEGIIVSVEPLRQCPKDYG